MTTKGYDPKSIKLPKSIKRMAANFIDPHKRGSFIKSYVKMFEEQSRSIRKKK